MYDDGYVFTRLGRGIMQQTRSVRIDLSKFELTSENRRILKKTDDLVMVVENLPLKNYNYSIGKLAKDFYESKFGPKIMSAQKIKEMLTDRENSNWNTLFTYSDIGYAICFVGSTLLHYSYPFYDLNKAPNDMGMGMMLRAITYAKDLGLKYIYLGSLQRLGDVYKLQFEGLEWYDEKKWSTDLAAVKKILSSDKMKA